MLIPLVVLLRLMSETLMSEKNDINNSCCSLFYTITNCKLLKVHASVYRNIQITAFFIMLQNPVAHCWSEQVHVKRKFCNVCRKRLDDNICIRCESKTKFMYNYNLQSLFSHYRNLHSIFKRNVTDFCKISCLNICY